LADPARPAPLILALETATAAISVALLRGPELIAERRAPDGPAATTLLPCIDMLLEDSGAVESDVDAFAVSVGPGSFTSLRVGIATAKGLAFGTRRPIAAVSTLAALADRVAVTDACVVSLLDARRGEVYAAAFRGDAQRTQLLDDGVYTPEQLCDSLNAPLVAVGEGVAIVETALHERFGSEVEFVRGALGEASARCVGVRGAALLSSQGGHDAAELVPRYVRRAEAEVKRTGERFEP
jgi:tRNA threonylcarbamoyladenosine biosynthesis protein TsaB